MFSMYRGNVDCSGKTLVSKSVDIDVDIDNIRQLSNENLISQVMNSIFFSSNLTLSMLYPDN